MNEGEIDRLQVNQLSDRYNLARSAVYTRLDALGIKPEKIGNKAYVSAEQLLLLDELHAFIQTGRSTAEFLEMKGIQRAEASPSGQSSGLSTVQPEMMQFIAAIAAEIASRFQTPAPEPNPLAYFELLEQACRNGWLLRTSELAELLDLPPSEVGSYDSFSEAGFVFTRAGYRAGGEVAWKVSKPVK